ncbi:hypothetical protein F0231_00200 [Vibrio sp. RE86]|uniref:hypothetical protein n=1 Tax=Vibrio sp. RE86 TaxID=2607605 RepID=UPI001493A014|nr:hypothetical protein [Vibrio sp. RE86]NOH78153.1 hypothetical protein [Vibrio sp. RE86]
MEKFHFKKVFVSTCGLFALFLFAAFQFDVYLVFPFFALFAYSSLIGGLLWALTLASKRGEFVVTAIGLIFLGTFASVDILLATDEAIEHLINLPYVHLSKETLHSLNQVLLVLINIFTGSLAANVLFHGLCKPLVK